MIRKEIVDPGHVRRMPDGFGWLDHRLVRKGHLKGKSREALALYLFLVIVADADGVSYYSENSLCEHLNFTSSELVSSRNELVNAELAAYRKPFYQILDLPFNAEEKENFSKVMTEVHTHSETSCKAHKDGCIAIGEIIKTMTGE